MSKEANCCLCGVHVEEVIVRCRKEPICVECHMTVVSLAAAQFDDPEARELLVAAYTKAEAAHAVAGSPPDPRHVEAKQHARATWGEG